MEHKFHVEGNSSSIEEFEKFLVSQGVEAKSYTVTTKRAGLNYPEPDPDKYETGDRSTLWLMVVSTVGGLAKKIVEFLAAKKGGSITLRAGAKSKKITKRDTAGNIEEYLEEHKGTTISIKVEI